VKKGLKLAIDIGIILLCTYSK